LLVRQPVDLQPKSQIGARHLGIGVLDHRDLACAGDFDLVEGGDELLLSRTPLRSASATRVRSIADRSVALAHRSVSPMSGDVVRWAMGSGERGPGKDARPASMKTSGGRGSERADERAPPPGPLWSWLALRPGAAESLRAAAGTPGRHLPP